MKYKKIITSGCSFSDPVTPFTWPNQLEKHIERLDPTVKFDHRGLSSQGQELIQKKTLHAIHEALEQGYRPEDIAVFVMWSSNDRKSFYVDHGDFVNELVENWKGSQQGWQLQLGDLKNFSENPGEVTSKADKINNVIRYNKWGGWLITSAHTIDAVKFVRDYFMMGAGEPCALSVHTSLENIIMLQHTCKTLGIKLYQQYFMDLTFNDFEKIKDHQIVQYLLKQLDTSTFISPEKSIHGYLLPNPECFKDVRDPHPNGLGHRRWLTEVILPHLVDDGFFD
jgi:hypothetical protein